MNTKASRTLIQNFFALCCALLLPLCASAAMAEQQIAVSNAWVRGTLPGQDMSAAYMTLVSQQDAILIRAESDVTKSVELHSMTMQNGIMKMRMLDKIALTANKPLQLAPGGLHLMLFDLKQPLSNGQLINFDLTFKIGSAEFKQRIKVPVKSLNENDAHDHSHHHH